MVRVGSVLAGTAETGCAPHRVLEIIDAIKGDPSTGTITS
jgi:hypothetical protein